jgi:hypothetical protein
MPVKQNKSVFDKYGDTRAVLEKHKNDPINYGFVSLPPGITNGEAVLTACYVKEQEDGSLMWRAEGSILSPNSVTTETGVVTVKGLFTSVRVFVGSRPSDEEFEAAITKIREELCKLGGETFLSDNEGMTLEEASKLLAEQKPPIKFRFSTSVRKQQIDPKTGKPKLDPKTNQPYPPGVWENWHGTRGLDSTPPDDVHTGKFLDKTHAPGTNGVAGEAGAMYAEMDLTALLQKAEHHKDEDAQNRLREFCRDNGYTDDEFDAASWAEVRGMVSGRRKEEKATLAVVPATIPKTGDVVWYAPPDPKDAAKSQKERECEIDKVDEKKKTADLHPFSNTRTKYLAVPWDKLRYE